MKGMNRVTSQWIEGNNHLEQSLEDIVTTPKGTRVLARNYGIDTELVDRPMDYQSLGGWTYATVEALENSNEPRVELDKIQLNMVSKNGELGFTMHLNENQTPDLKGVIQEEFKKGGIKYNLPEPVTKPLSVEQVDVSVLVT